MERERLFIKIRKIVTGIPEGKVATYGSIAKLAGIKDARKVGWALYGNQNPQIPCHRVVKAGGFLAEKYSLGGVGEQKKRLIAEGVSFLRVNQVDVRKHHLLSYGDDRPGRKVACRKRALT